MSTGHTPQQWRALHSEITAMLLDPNTPGDRRKRAEEIMGMIRRNPVAQAAINETPTMQDLGWTEFI